MRIHCTQHSPTHLALLKPPSPSEKGCATPRSSAIQRFWCELKGHRSVLLLQQQCYFKMVLDNYKQFWFYLLDTEMGLFYLTYRVVLKFSK